MQSVGVHHVTLEIHLFAVNHLLNHHYSKNQLNHANHHHVVLIQNVDPLVDYHHAVA